MTKTPMWNPDLQCCVQSITFRDDGKTVILELPRYNVTDMSGAIRFATQISPQVKTIETWQEKCRDTFYRKTTAGWQAETAQGEHGEPFWPRQDHPHTDGQTHPTKTGELNT